MESLLYLAKVGIIYAVLYLIYYLFFRNDTNFQVNRIYLVLILPFAFILPIINTSVEVATQFQITLPAIDVGGLSEQETFFNWSDLLLYCYIFVSGVLLLKLLATVFKTLQTISKINQEKHVDVQPFSFFSFIHVPNNIEEKARMAIIHHEKIHSIQLHSLDIIIYEICKILLWWNPFLWMGLNSVKSNHEFIADKLASEKTDKYSSVLVAQLLGVNCSALANNFNYEPLIKKRIMMIKTKRSTQLSIFKYVLVIPVIALTVATTAQKTGNILAKEHNPFLPNVSIPSSTPQVAQIGNDDKVYETVDVMPEFKGGTDALMAYLGNNVKYPEGAKKNNIEGIVYVSFVVDKKGEIKETSVLKAAAPLLDAEAIRVIGKMPKWKPGKKDGKKVNVKYTIPINFKLQE